MSKIMVAGASGLMQIGTAIQASADGKTFTYYPWFEYLNGSSDTGLTPITDNSVSPGVPVHLEVSYDSSSQTCTMNYLNETTGKYDYNYSFVCKFLL